MIDILAEVREMNQTIYQKGLEDGFEKGRAVGEAELLLWQLNREFGDVDEATVLRLRRADADRLLPWGEGIVTAASLDEVFSE